MSNLLNIVVIGVGGGGGNMISHLIKDSYKEIKHIAANTDIQALGTGTGAAPYIAEVSNKLGILTV